MSALASRREGQTLTAEVLAATFDLRYDAEKEKERLRIEEEMENGVEHETEGRPSRVVLDYVEGPLPEEIMADLQGDTEVRVGPKSPNSMRRSQEKSATNHDELQAMQTEVNKSRSMRQSVAQRKSLPDEHGGPRNQQDGHAAPPKRPAIKAQRRGALGQATSSP